MLMAPGVTMGGCWTDGVWLVSGQTAWSASSWFSFPIIFPNSKSEIDANVQMLEHVLDLLMMEVISPWDTRTMWRYSAKKGQRLLLRNGHLTARLIGNRTWLDDMAHYTLSEVELKTLKTIIETHLANGSIEGSMSAVAAPILFT